VIACAILAIVLLAYTYVGYPIAIGVLARVAGRRAHGHADADGGEGGEGRMPTVTVCLPVFNGAAALPAKIDSLLAQDYPADRLDIVIYCDGCADDSERVARELAASARAAGRIQVLVSAERRGKPTAINTVAAAATGELVLLNDVRQPLSPNAVRELAQAMADPRVGCATGILVLEGAAGSGVYWRYESWIRRQESRFRGVVGMTGSIAMMRRADIRPLPADVILDDVWMPMQAGLEGKRVVAVEHARAYDAAFDDDREFGRKVRTLAGNYQLFAQMPALLSPLANRIWFETVSHKIMRLWAPWLMIVLAAASLAGLRGAAPWSPWLALSVAQAGFYGAAALGRRAGKLGGVARTFVVLNAAAVVGLFRYLGGRQRVTW